MYRVYEVFTRDGRKYLLFEHRDYFECFCWSQNHEECTNALKNRWSFLQIEEVEA